MDFFGPFKTDVLRPLIILVVPGAVVTGSVEFAILRSSPAIESFAAQHTNAAWSVTWLSVLAVGVMLEDVGAVIEGMQIDERLDKENEFHKAEWHSYLKLKLKDEMIGQRYLKEKLTQLKFELSMSMAFVLAWVALVVGQWRAPFCPWWVFAIISVVALGMTVGGWRVANMSAELLSETRHLILEGMGQGAAKDEGSSTEKVGS